MASAQASDAGTGERRHIAYRDEGLELHERLIGHFERDNRANVFWNHVPDTILLLEDGETTLLPAFKEPAALPSGLGELVKRIPG
jgi:hypothetical protein